MARTHSFLMLLAVICISLPRVAQTDQVPANPLTQLRVGSDQTKAIKINEAIYQALGFGNTFLVTTRAGNVIIDTSMAFNAARHKQLLEAEQSRLEHTRVGSKAAIKYINPDTRARRSYGRRVCLETTWHADYCAAESRRISALPNAAGRLLRPQ